MDKDTDTVRTCNGMAADFVDKLAEAFGDSAFETVDADDGFKSIVARDVPAWLRERAEGLRTEGPEEVEREIKRVQENREAEEAWATERAERRQEYLRKAEERRNQS